MFIRAVHGAYFAVFIGVKPISNVFVQIIALHISTDFFAKKIYGYGYTQQANTQHDCTEKEKPIFFLRARLSMHIAFLNGEHRVGSFFLGFHVFFLILYFIHGGTSQAGNPVS